MPELEPGMVIECDWGGNRKHEYLYLGNNKTLKLSENNIDRSQPLIPNDKTIITKIYNADDILSWNNYMGKCNFATRTLIWQRESEAQNKINALEETIYQAQMQIQEIKQQYS